MLYISNVRRANEQSQKNSKPKNADGEGEEEAEETKIKHNKPVRRRLIRVRSNALRVL